MKKQKLTEQIYKQISVRNTEKTAAGYVIKMTTIEQWTQINRREKFFWIYNVLHNQSQENGIWHYTTRQNGALLLCDLWTPVNSWQMESIHIINGAIENAKDSLIKS